MAMSIGNVAFWVSDLERSTTFYRDGLGLDVIARIETAQVREVIVGRRDTGSQLMLAHRVGHEGPVTPAGVWKVYLSTDDLDADCARAIRAGASVDTEPTHLKQFKITIAVLADPDGYLLELGQVHPS
jgi:lactoylglutathione lyase